MANCQPPTKPNLRRKQDEPAAPIKPSLTADGGKSAFADGRSPERAVGSLRNSDAIGSGTIGRAWEGG